VASNCLDTFFVDMVEGEIAASGQTALVWPLAAQGVVPKWSSIGSFAEAKRTAILLGFSAGVGCWDLVGIRTDGSPPLAEDLERRRSLLRMIFSAADAHAWPESDKDLGVAYVTEVERALVTCHAELPDLAKKLRKKKAGRSLVPAWQEPSALLFEYAVRHTGPDTISALHLSNLQGHELNHPSIVPAGPHPKILPVIETREMYTKLSQAQCKIEEALRIFRDKTVLVWAPENTDSIPKIIAGLRSLYTAHGIRVALQFLISFTPLPGCDAPELILDLWTHPLLRQSNCVSNILFIREASRCVFTRNNNPLHIVKSVVAVTVQAEAPRNVPQELSMKSLLLDIPVQGGRLLIDGPTESIHTIWQIMNAHPIDDGVGGIVDWKLERRSRANNPAHARSILVGQTCTTALLILRHGVASIKSVLGGRGDCIIGHSSMYADNTNLLMEGTLHQILALQVHTAECVAVSPNKALFSPGAPAEVFCAAITEAVWLQTLVMKYRNSGPLKGRSFARPRALPSHVAAQRHNSWISHLPGERAALLRCQLIIEVLDLDAGNCVNLPGLIMDKIRDGLAEGNRLVEIKDQFVELTIHQWRMILRDDRWSGKILLQCANTEEVEKLYDCLHGTRICMCGLHKTIDISSPTDVLLSSRAPVAASVSCAGQPTGAGS
jgi:hypothetical protein